MRVPPLLMILRVVFAVALLGGLAWFAREYATAHFSPSRLRLIVDQFGVLAPVVYVIVYAVAPLFFFPASLLTAAAGLLWDWRVGLLLALIGNNLCANLGFWSARALGQERIQSLTRGRLRRLDKRLEGAGFKVVAILRMLPIMPFTTLSYTAGMSRITWRDFALGHFLGTLPGTTVFIIVLEIAITD